MFVCTWNYFIKSVTSIVIREEIMVITIRKYYSVPDKSNEWKIKSGKNI